MKASAPLKPSLGRVGVVVVTHHPEGDIRARLRSWKRQGAELVVVDNASRAELCDALGRECAEEGHRLIANAENRGLGAALNQGVAELSRTACEWILFFDQDSDPAEDLSERLLESVSRHAAPGRVAAVGANFEDSATGTRHRFLRRYPRLPLFFEKRALSTDDLEVTMVITSGSMIRTKDIAAAGGFNEGFFIDYLDTDLCLRLLSRGRLVLASAGARLEHALGARSTIRWCGLTVHATHHSALRHYYIARNRVPMWRRHAWRHPHWALFDLCATALWLGRVLVVENSKWRKVKAMLWGSWDGLCGRAGPCPEKRRRRFGV